MHKTPPVLALHQAGHRLLYELSGLRTGSIRDQVVRAQMLVEALLDDTMGLDASLPLLVLGGGAAGVACALTAVSKGKKVVFLEKEIEPFRTQEDVDTRWIDPVEFDWPQTHWRDAQLPGSIKPNLPLRAMTAADMADGWKILYRRMLLAHPDLLIPVHANAYDWNVQPASLGNGLIAYDRTDEDAPKELTHCAAISCIGFSGEKTTVESTTGTHVQGPQFWGPDDIDNPTLGTGRIVTGATEATRLHALVSGGGDGAMQDFVRVATGSMGRELHGRMGLLGIEGAPQMIEVLMAEDAARRAHSWSPTPQSKDAFRRWHLAYEGLAEAVWKFWTDKTLLDEVEKRVLRPGISVTWVIGGEVPGYSYGLNRLLATLVARLVARRGERPLTGNAKKLGEPEPECRPVIVTGLKLKSLAAFDPHRCDGTCYARPHMARLQRSLDAPSPDDYVTGPFDLVIIRHGVDQRPYFGGAAVSEQITPFSFPE